MADKKRILLIEDEEHLREGLQLNLEMEGYEIELAETGSEAIEKFKSQRFDLLILDVMLPNINGFDVCQSVRLHDQSIPVLFLSARSAAEDRIEGLKRGGDDYLVKPFNLEELLLRVSNLLKRSKIKKEPGSAQDIYYINNKTIDFKKYLILEGNNEIYTLSPREAQLLRLLIDKENEVVSRSYILETVWGFDVYPTTRTIDNYILTYRKLFENDSRQPQYFHSVRGVGYKFTNRGNQ